MGQQGARRRERMGDLEALMWSLESDPHLSSTFANLTLFDRSPDHDRLRRRLWRASRVVPRLRRRIHPEPAPFAPTWEDDPDFDLDRHLRVVQLPAGATDADVRELAVALAAAPFEPGRPLWEFTVIEGLPGGRAAMVQKMHHTITDGEGGIRMSVEFIDLDRDAAEPPAVDDGPPPRSDIGSGGDPTTGGPGPDTGPPIVAAVLGSLDLLGDGARRGVERARRLVGSANDLVRQPDLVATLATLPSDTAATASSLLRQFGVTGSHRSPLWTERSLDRHLSVFDVPLDRVKATATHLGGSVNDLFVAAAAGGAGRYHRSRGADVDELRMTMPVSTRTDRAPGGNAFAPTRVLVPLTADPRRRFAELHERLTVTKTERAMSLTPAVAALGKLLPRPILVRIARQQVMTVDFTTSNVRAAPFDLYIAGALMERNYPLGPVAGTAWNLTTMSYRGSLNLGLHADAGAVAEPEALACDIQDEFEALLALGPKRRSGPSRS